MTVNKKRMIFAGAIMSLFILMWGCRTSTSSDESEPSEQNPSNPTNPTDPVPATKTYTVTFIYNVDGEEDIGKTQVFTDGIRQKLTPFAELGYTAPAGKIFGGWVRGTGDEDKDRKADPDTWDNELMGLDKDIKLYARYGTGRTVTFNPTAGTGSLDAIEIVEEFPMPVVRKGEDLTAPSGKVFAGWAETGTKAIIVRTGENVPAGTFTALDAIWMGMETVEKGTGWKIGTSLTYPNGNGKERDPIDVQFENSYLLSDHEVTYFEWKKIMKQDITEYVENAVFQDYEPMRFVSWYEAIIYCNRRSVDEGLEPVYEITGCDWENVKLTKNGSPTFESVTCDFTKNGYRLPTEAEWECAARGSARATVTDKYLTVNTEKSYDTWEEVGNDLSLYGWSGNKSAPQLVMSCTPQNGYYDMYGNVHEWCWDNYENTYSANRTSQQGAFEGANSYDTTSIKNNKLYRGGGYNSSVNNQNANWQRITYRDTGESPLTRKAELGFRVCRTVTP